MDVFAERRWRGVWVGSREEERTVGRVWDKVFLVLDDSDLEGVGRSVDHIADFQLDAKNHRFAEKIFNGILRAVVEFLAGKNRDLDEWRFQAGEGAKFANT